MADTRDLKSLVRKNMRVRAPPPVPRRSKVRFAPTSFYACGKKDVIRPLPCSSFPNRTRCAGLRFGIGCSPEVSASILLRCYTSPRTSYRSRRRFLKPPFARFVVAPLQRLRPPYGCDVPRRGKVRFAPAPFCTYGIKTSSGCFLAPPLLITSANAGL